MFHLQSSEMLLGVGRKYLSSVNRACSSAALRVAVRGVSPSYGYRSPMEVQQLSRNVCRCTRMHTTCSPSNVSFTQNEGNYRHHSQYLRRQYSPSCQVRNTKLIQNKRKTNQTFSNSKSIVECSRSATASAVNYICQEKSGQNGHCQASSNRRQFVQLKDVDSSVYAGAVAKTRVDGGRNNSQFANQNNSNAFLRQFSFNLPSHNDISLRNFCTGFTLLNQSDGASDGTGKKEEEYSEMEEWIHPDQRSDSILDSDPELKLMLRELAADFGRNNVAENHNSANAAQPDKENPVAGKETTDAVNDKIGGHKDQDRFAPAEMKNGKTEGEELFEPIISENAEKLPEKKFVFSVDALVSILREENAQDICVINIPKEKQYVDYFVVVTGRSPRHLRAMTLHINQQYKSRKTKEDPFVLVEGDHTDDWMCIDFGNIVLHLMSEETREFYELEKLWTLGPEYDDQLRRLKEYEAKIQDVIAIESSPTGQAARSGSDAESDKPELSFVQK